MLFHHMCMKESILELPRLLLAGNSDVWPVELVKQLFVTSDNVDFNSLTCKR